MVCYFLFPLLSYIFKMKNNAIILLILLIITAFLPLIAIKYSLNLYTNIISRVIEFSIGIILYYNYKKNENMCFKHIYIC